MIFGGRPGFTRKFSGILGRPFSFREAAPYHLRQGVVSIFGEC